MPSDHFARHFADPPRVIAQRQPHGRQCPAAPIPQKAASTPNPQPVIRPIVDNVGRTGPAEHVNQVSINVLARNQSATANGHRLIATSLAFKLDTLARRRTR